MKKKFNFNWNKNKKLYIIACSVLLTLSIIIILAVALTSCSGGYGKNFDAGQKAYLSGDYDTAIEKLGKAIDAKPTEEAYMLLASSYMGNGNETMALQVLYLGYSRTGSTAIYDMMEKVKAGEFVPGIPNVNVTPKPSGETVKIAGSEYDLNSTSLNISSKGLTDSDLKEITKFTKLESLNLSGNRISDPAPLADLGGLKFLQLNDNDIKDPSSLTALKKLETLYLDGNPIEDFKTLHKFTSLRTLSIKDIEITDKQLEELQKALPNCKIYSDEAIEEIEEITLGGVTFKADVTELDLSGRGIVDITPLSACTELRTLKLANNGIANLSALVDMQKLEYLDLANNNVSDITNLMSLTQLKTLNLCNDYVRDLSPLSYLVKLEKLDLSYCHIERGHSALGNLSNLRELNLCDTTLKDEGIAFLKNLNLLTTLNITENPDITAGPVEELKKALPNCNIKADDLRYKIKLGDYEYYSDSTTSIVAPDLGLTELKDIEQFKKLTQLSLANSALTNISCLRDLTNLEVLELYSNRVADLSPLSGLTKLRILDVMSNGCSSISALSSCTNLEQAYLSGNGISSISALSSCTKLNTLWLDGNNISNISPLGGLTNLTTLYLDQNPIADFEPLYGLVNLRNLSLYNTGITAEQAEHLQELLPECNIVWG